jgi:hypothetical protein
MRPGRSSLGSFLGVRPSLGSIDRQADPVETAGQANDAATGTRNRDPNSKPFVDIYVVSYYTPECHCEEGGGTPLEPGWNASPPWQGHLAMTIERGELLLFPVNFTIEQEPWKIGRGRPDGRRIGVPRNTNILSSFAQGYGDNGPGALVNLNENTSGARADQAGRGGTTTSNIRYLAVSCSQASGGGTNRNIKG